MNISVTYQGARLRLALGRACGAQGGSLNSSPPPPGGVLSGPGKARMLAPPGLPRAYFATRTHTAHSHEVPFTHCVWFGSVRVSVCAACALVGLVAVVLCEGVCCACTLGCRPGLKSFHRS